MGSPILPLPGTASWGNPTGIKGSNPVFEAENTNNLKQLTSPVLPAGGQQATITGGVVMPPAKAPVYTPVQAAPAVPAPGAGTFGYGMPKPQVQSPLAGADWKGMFDSIRRTYGYDAADTVTKALGQSWNSAVPETLLKNMEPLFQENMANLMEQFGGAGQRFGSTAALAAGKMTADFGSQQEAMLAQLYQNAYNQYLNVLMSTLAPKKSNGWGTLGNILGLVSTGATALATAGVGGGAEAGGVGAALAGLAAL